MDDDYGFEELLEGDAPAKTQQEPGVTGEGLQAILKAAIDDAVDYCETDLAQERQDSIDAYRGEGLENDSELDATRSQAMSKDVHDTVHAILPSLMRVFFGGQEVVSYQPEGPEDEQFAQQATDYVNEIVLRKDNEGFMIFHSAFKDALIKALGVIKWWWDESFMIEARSYSGLDQLTFQVLAGDPSVTEVYEYVEDEMGFISCTVTRRVSQGGKLKLAAVPPEERLIDRAARSVDDSTFYGHRRTMTVSDLVAMGFDFNQVVMLGGAELLETNEEAIERYDGQNYNENAPTSDPSQRKVEYIEAYLRVDLDADGVAELYRICCGGTAHTILLRNGAEAIDLVDEIPFAELCPDPEPHLATGHSIAEQVEDIQKVKSGLLRGALDSLSRAIFPREEVVEQQVNMDDVLNPEIGATIRTKAPGMIREITTNFMGRECLPVMEYMDNVKADRTGISDTTQGLDPQAMQSTTAAGVNAAVSASQNQIELIARILAQTGVTRMFRGLLKTIKTHQDQTRVVKLRNNWTEVDPRAWNAGMDAQVNVALGRGTETEKMAMLGLIAQKQENVIQQLGPVNPLCTIANYRNTLAEVINIAGFYNPDKFLLPVDMGQQVQQFMGQMDQLNQQVQELTQENGALHFELQKHTEAEDAVKHADAFKKGTESLKNVVDAAQTAATPVPTNAVDDEVAATKKHLQ